MRSNELQAARFRTEGGIHATAVVDANARIAISAKIGPYVVVGPNVEIGEGAIIHSHAVLDGYTSLGAGVEVFPFAAVGLRPQDKKYDGSPTRLVVGDRTVIRECVTLQPGTSGEGCGVTRIGADCLIMAYSHVAHDCAIGDSVVIANSTQIAGHCTIEDHVILGGATTIHQFLRVGTRAITGAASRLQQDVPPYMLADGHPARLFGLNVVGLKRAKFSKEALAALKRAYKALFLRGGYAEALADLEQGAAKEHPEIAHLCRFLKESQRGVMRASLKRRARSRANE
jgi:UDP-N-acetylglucosamine acyltransferase